MESNEWIVKEQLYFLEHPLKDLALIVEAYDWHYLKEVWYMVSFSTGNYSTRDDFGIF